MRQLKQTFLRLKRHYSHSIKTYDEISLLDLSHVLRIWTEMKFFLDREYVTIRQKAIFKSGAPIRKTTKAIKNCQYVLSYLPPDGVTTYVSNGNLLSADKIDNTSDKVTFGVKVMQKSNSIILSQYQYFSKMSNPELAKSISMEKVSSNNFKNWMGTEIVRVRFKNNNGDFKEHIISREILIKRVANILDGSHSSLNNEEGDSPYNEAVKWLMKFTCGGAPLPYFLLLKIAQDIILNMPNLVEDIE